MHEDMQKGLADDNADFIPSDTDSWEKPGHILITPS